jgi:thiol-disulfide isomerase/thioredoxin
MESHKDNENIVLEKREDLINLLKESSCEYVVLKFYADWCKPCKQITPFVEKLMNEKSKHFETQGVKNKFIYISVDVDECFDLYAFMKKQKMLNGIPAIFLYSKKVYQKNEENKIHIPQMSISGTDKDKISKLLNNII